ncbi:MAG: nitroreductase family protein [Planctomycetota bacterium]
MNTLDAIEKRHSTRAFLAKPVPKEILEKIADAGRRAPTARNVQPWAFVLVTDGGMRGKLAALAETGRFIADAPACLAVFCRDTKYYIEDGCAAVENILLAATALGVQSCWVAGDKKPYAAEVARLLGAPGDHKLIALLPLGYAATPGKSTARRPLADILHREKF